MAPRSDPPRGAVFLRTVALLLAVVAGLGGLAAYLYLHDRAAERRIHEHDGLSMVDLQTETIAREARFVGSDLLYLLHQKSLEESLDGLSGSRDRLLAEYLEFCRLKGLYDGIGVLDGRGQELVRVSCGGGQPRAFPRTELVSRADRDEFRQAIQLGRDEVYASPLDLDTEHGQVERPIKPVIRFAAPIFDAGGQRRGVVVLTYLGRRLLQALDEASAGFHGTLMLLDERGFYLRGPRPEDEWGFALGHGRKFADDHPDAWRGVAQVERTQLTAARGLYTSRKVRLTRTGRAWLPEDVLILVTWVPRAELQQASDRFRNRLLLTALGLFPAILFAAWWVSRASVVRRENERTIAESEARLRKLSAELLDAQERERASLSRDLHDDLGQLVTSVTLDLERARQADGGKREQLIERALSGTRLLLERMHEIAARIRPRILDDLGLHDAVKSYLAGFEDRTGVEVAYDLDLGDVALPGVLSENVYRILQEALTNVAKHAHARTVSVALRATAERLSLRVRDDGAGFVPEAAAGAGLGLLGMRERVELLHGRLVLESRPACGTTLEVDLPVAGGRR